MNISRTTDEILNVKPVLIQLVHTKAYEGPCRNGKGVQLTSEYDEKIAAELIAQMKYELPRLYCEKINVMEPTLITWHEDFIMTNEHFRALEKDLGETDIFLVYGHLCQYGATQIAHKFNKPVGVPGCCLSTDVCAYLKYSGLEGYAYIDYEDAHENFKLLRAKKGISRTRILSILKDDVVTKGVASGIRDFNNLRVKYGIELIYKNAQDMLDEIDKLSEDELKQAEDIKNSLVANAKCVYMPEKEIIKSVCFYLVVKKLLAKYDCNAFMTPCFEICATRRLNDERYTFCLAHSLLKEEGIPSACEADLNSLLALDVLMNIRDVAPHMGNFHPLTQREIMAMDGRQNLVNIHHSVPTRYMAGRNGKMAEYSLQSFTESGWGVTMRYDFNQDIGKTVTFLRFDPSGTKMLAIKGTIVKDVNHDVIGCSDGFIAEVDDVKDMFRKQKYFGHHFAWTYGDLREELKEFGDVMGIEVVTA